jgi:type II secretory pathway pseudopilin PulG
MHTRFEGLTIIEVLIALAVVSVALLALSASQITNLRASTVARTGTDTKAAANRVLEQVTARVLRTTTSGSTTLYDFNDYYWRCPTPPQTPPTPYALPLQGGFTEPCTGTFYVSSAGVSASTSAIEDDIRVTFEIRGEPGIVGEGVVSISVTARHPRTAQTLTIGDRITCYDVYPSPSANAPDPCPIPRDIGTGRS